MTWDQNLFDAGISAATQETLLPSRQNQEHDGSILRHFYVILKHISSAQTDYESKTVHFAQTGTCLSVSSPVTSQCPQLSREFKKS
jgi:hypothetical protein